MNNTVKPLKNQSINFTEIEPSLLARYEQQDVEITHRLYLHMKKQNKWWRKLIRNLKHILFYIIKRRV
jgi:hypothetical protein